MGGGGVGSGWGGGQGGCERRIEVFGKIHKKKFGGGGGGGGGIRVRLGSGWWGGVGVDVKEELKLLRKFKKKIWGGRGCLGGKWAGNKLEGDWGEIVAIGAEISPKKMPREKSSLPKKKINK